jgi:hypothetical protein
LGKVKESLYGRLSCSRFGVFSFPEKDNSMRFASLCSRVLMVVILVGSVGRSAHAATIIASPTDLFGAANLITFDEVILSDGTALDTQYSAYGVTFSSLFYNPQFLNFGDVQSPGAANFPPATNPFSIYFNAPVSGATVAYATNPGDATTFTALLNGIVQETFTLPTDLSGTHYGFFGITFNELRFAVTDNVNGAAALDNIAFTPAASPVPEPTSLLLLGSGVVGATAKLRRRKQQAQTT